VTLGTINFLGVLAALFQAMPSLSFQARRPAPAPRPIGYRVCGVGLDEAGVWPARQPPR